MQPISPTTCYVCGAATATLSASIARPWDDQKHDLLVCSTCGATTYADASAYIADHSVDDQPRCRKQLTALSITFQPPASLS